MGWLTGYSYRQSIPVANPSTQGDRALDAVPFPAWFLATSAGGSKIAETTTFADVHVTTSDGTTELPCVLNAAKNALYIDYASMPVGRTVLYVYYGKSGASAPTGISFYTAARGTAGLATPTETGGTVLDNFESGNDGDILSATWTSINTPQRREVDTAQYRSGTRSAWLQGANGGWSGVKETTSAGMTADGAEYRWWARFATAFFRECFLVAAWAVLGPRRPPSG
jgi:hypothetical protein